MSGCQSSGDGEDRRLRGGSSWRWARHYLRASQRLCRVLASCRSMAFHRVARVVLRGLPRTERRAMQRVVHRATAGGRRRLAVTCEIEGIGGGRGVLLRLALFGLPGEGRPAEQKHREGLLQQLTAEITRETCDVPTLDRTAARVLNQPVVLADPVLAGSLRAFIAERRSMLEREAAERRRLIEGEDEPRHAPAPRDGRVDAPPTREQILAAFERLRVELEDELLHLNLTAAQNTLARVEEMARRYPAYIASSALEHCRAEASRGDQRFRRLREQVHQLTEQAVSAAQQGNHEVAAQALRRLSSVHASRPMLLPDAEFAAIRERIATASDAAEHRSAARELVARERAVAADIRKLATIIHRFHVVSRRVPHTGEEWRRAEEVYNAAVREVRSHDADWMAGLILEVDTLLEEIHDTSGQAAAQADRFLASVRAALAKLRAEIRAIEQEQKTPAGVAPTSPSQPANDAAQSHLPAGTIRPPQSPKPTR